MSDPRLMWRVAVAGNDEGGIPAVIAGKDHGRVITQSQFIEAIQQGLEIAVEHLDTSATTPPFDESCPFGSTTKK